MTDRDLGELPSLANTVAAVRRELAAAVAEGQGKAIAFRAGPVELEFEVAVTWTGGGEAGVRLWVLTLNAKAEREAATTQRIKLTLQPLDPHTGQDARITDTGTQRGWRVRRHKRLGWLAAAGPEGVGVGVDRHRVTELYAAGPATEGSGRGTGWEPGWCSPPGM